MDDFSSAPHEWLFLRARMVLCCMYARTIYDIILDTINTSPSLWHYLARRGNPLRDPETLSVYSIHLMIQA